MTGIEPAKVKLTPCERCGEPEGEVYANAGWFGVECHNAYAAMLAASPATPPSTASVVDPRMEHIAAGFSPLPEDPEIETTWRDLALQFDGHRMDALAILRWIDRNGFAPEVEERISTFLAAPPLSGETVLAQRIDAILAIRSTK